MSSTIDGGVEIGSRLASETVNVHDNTIIGGSGLVYSSDASTPVTAAVVTDNHVSGSDGYAVELHDDALDADLVSGNDDAGPGGANSTDAVLLDGGFAGADALNPDGTLAGPLQYVVDVAGLDVFAGSTTIAGGTEIRFSTSNGLAIDAGASLIVHGALTGTSWDGVTADGAALLAFDGGSLDGVDTSSHPAISITDVATVRFVNGAEIHGGVEIDGIPATDEVTISGSDFEDAVDDAVRLDGVPDLSGIGAGNTFSGNGVDAFVVAETTLSADWSVGSGPFVIDGVLSVPSGRTLTVPAATTLSFLSANGSSELFVEGTASISGTVTDWAADGWGGVEVGTAGDVTVSGGTIAGVDSLAIDAAGADAITIDDGATIDGSVVVVDPAGLTSTQISGSTITSDADDAAIELDGDAVDPSGVHGNTLGGPQPYALLSANTISTDWTVRRRRPLGRRSGARRPDRRRAHGLPERAARLPQRLQRRRARRRGRARPEWHRQRSGRRGLAWRRDRVGRHDGLDARRDQRAPTPRSTPTPPRASTSSSRPSARSTSSTSTTPRCASPATTSTAARMPPSPSPATRSTHRE